MQRDDFVAMTSIAIFATFVYTNVQVSACSRYHVSIPFYNNNFRYRVPNLTSSEYPELGRIRCYQWFNSKNKDVYCTNSNGHILTVSWVSVLVELAQHGVGGNYGR